MRPALLVVVMDFLVSSLLLFVSGPGSGWSIGHKSADPHQMPAIASEFSVAAVARMEQEWQAEYQAEYRAAQVARQQQMLSQAADDKQLLVARQKQLEEQLSASTSQLGVMRSARAQAEAAKKQLEQEQARLKSALKEREAQTQDLERQKAALQEAGDLLQQQYQETAAGKDAAEAAKKQLEQEQARLKSALKEREAQTQDLERQKAALQEAGDLLQQQYQKTAAGKDAAEQTAESLQKQVQDYRQRIFSQASTIGDQDRLIASQQEIITQSLRDVARVQTQLETNFHLLSLAELQVIKEQQEQLQQVLKEQQKELQSGLTGLTAHLEEINSRQTGPFTAIKEAYLPVSAVLSAVYGRAKAGPQTVIFSNVVYAPLIDAGDAFYLITHSHDLGLKSLVSAPILHHIDWTARTRKGEVCWEINDQQNAFLLADEPAVVCLDFVGLKQADKENMSKSLQPLELIGKDALTKRGTRDVFLVKRNAENAAFPVEATPDQAEPSHLKIQHSLRPWANFMARRLWLDPKSQPEAGDFIVTAEGKLVGVMLNE